MTKTERFLLRIGANPNTDGFRRLVTAVDMLKQADGSWMRMKDCVNAIANAENVTVGTVYTTLTCAVERIYSDRETLPLELVGNERTGRLSLKRFCIAAAMLLEDEQK